MTAIEKAQMWHLARRWHKYADELLRDEESKISWVMLDLADAITSIPVTQYLPNGQRRSLDA